MNKRYLFLVWIFACTAVMFAQEQKHLKHTIAEGESIYAIAALYETTVEVLFQLNPGAISELKPGTILLIPAKTANELSPEALQTEVTFKKHRVRRKETLYSISKKYNITIEEIKKHNEELYERELEKGEKIKIPIYKTIPLDELEEKKRTITHIVKSKETRWGIANSYGITIKELQEFNPDMGEVIKIGDTLYLPGRENIEPTPTSDDYIFYEVKPKETLYSLSRFLGISAEGLEMLNPDLKDGLKAGMILKLPKAKSEELEVRNAVVIKKMSLIDSIDTSHTSNIVLMLPFRLNTISINSMDLVKKRFKSDKVFNYALDFYSGALIAIDSVKKLGNSINVQVFDTEGSKSKIDELLMTNTFEDSHAIIGPFYSTPFNTLSEALKREDIPVIAPLTNKNITLYDNVFQTVPSEEYLREEMINFIVNHADDKQIIIITDPKNVEIKEKLQSKFPDAQTIVSEKEKTITRYKIKKMLSEEKENWILLETSSESLVANITSVLNSIDREKYKITLLTTDKTDVFDSDNISNVHLSNLYFHYPTIDKLSSSDNSFSKQYEARFYTTPSRYAIRGFDITFDILLRLAYSKSLYRAARNIGETEYVENKFNYNKKFFGGYYNKAYYIVKYDNLEIKQVKQ